MRKTLSLLVLLITLFSCSEKVEVTNFAFTPVIQATSGAVTNVQQPLSFSLKVLDVDEATDGKLDVVFSVKNGIGNLILEDRTLESGDKFTHNFIEDPIVKLKYLPKNSGKHTVSFTLSNAKVNKSVSFDVDVNDMVINVAAANIPQIPMVEKRLSFDLILSGDNLAELGECTLKASVSKGSGEIYKEDILISETGKTGILKEGRNVISYYAKETGENILKFDIASQYGYTQELLVPIDIQKPEFTVLSSIDVDSLPVAPAAQNFSFKLKLTDDYEHGSMTFKGNYHFITNIGSVKVNGKTVASGTDTEFKTGDNIITFNGSEAGIAEMEFIITNQYGVQKIEKVKFDVGGGSISLEARQIHTEVDLLDSTPIELTIVRPGYSGTFELQVTAIKGSGYISFNRAEYAVSGGWIRNLSNKEIIQFKPDRLEDVELEVSVRDSKGETVSAPIILKYTVINPPIQLSVKGYISEVMINNPTSFSFTLSKKNYSGKFRYLVTQNPIKVGSVLFEGQTVNQSLSLVTNPINALVQFTPTTYPANGEVKLNFTFTDEYNTIKDTSIVFNVQTPPINVWFDADRKEFPIGEAVNFIGRISSQGHDNIPFNISLKARNIPLVTWNGSRLNAISVLKAENNQQNDVKLQAVGKGENPITFVITDQYGKSVEKEISVFGTVSNNISFSPMSGPVLLPQTSKGTITLKSNDPDNRFFASYRVLKGRGYMRFNGYQVNPGYSFEVHSGDKEAVIPIEYASDGIADESIIEVTITDAYGTTHTENITSVFRGEISIMGKVSTFNKTATIRLSASEPVRDAISVTVRFDYTYRVTGLGRESVIRTLHFNPGDLTSEIIEKANYNYNTASIQLISVSPAIGQDGSKYVVSN
ncbi:MAG: hypothetical protein RR313_02675 [Anaerovoracaceae bacterium]